MLFKYFVEDVDFENDYIEYDVLDWGYIDKRGVLKIGDTYYNVDFSNETIDSQSDNLEDLIKDNYWLERAKIEDLDHFEIKKLDQRIIDEVLKFKTK